METRVTGLLVFLSGVLLLSSGMLIVPSEVYAQGSCPCNYAGAVRVRAITGKEMRCNSRDVDVFNVPPEGITNKQNQFIVTERSRKGDIRKTTSFDLYEQGLLTAADFGGVVRYGPTCVVRSIGKRKVRILDAAYIFGTEDYQACAEDLTALVKGVVSTATNNDANCVDELNNGVIDQWEPLLPTNHVCFNDVGGIIPCPALAN